MCVWKKKNEGEEAQTSTRHCVADKERASQNQLITELPSSHSRKSERKSPDDGGHRPSEVLPCPDWTETRKQVMGDRWGGWVGRLMSSKDNTAYSIG